MLTLRANSVVRFATVVQLRAALKSATVLDLGRFASHRLQRFAAVSTNLAHCESGRSYFRATGCRAEACYRVSKGVQANTVSHCNTLQDPCKSLYSPAYLSIT